MNILRGVEYLSHGLNTIYAQYVWFKYTEKDKFS